MHMRCTCTHLPLSEPPPAVCSRKIGAAARVRTAAATCTMHAAAAAAAAAAPQPRSAVSQGAPPSRAHTAAATAATAAAAMHAVAAARSNQGETEGAAGRGGSGFVELACVWSVQKLTQAPMHQCMHQCSNAPMRLARADSSAPQTWLLSSVEQPRDRRVRLRRQTGMPSGGAARKATCNTLGGGGGVSAAAGKARRCVPPPGAPAGGEQEGAGEQHARDTGAAQRDK